MLQALHAQQRQQQGAAGTAAAAGTGAGAAAGAGTGAAAPTRPVVQHGAALQVIQGLGHVEELRGPHEGALAAQPAALSNLTAKPPRQVRQLCSGGIARLLSPAAVRVACVVRGCVAALWWKESHGVQVAAVGSGGQGAGRWTAP